MRKIKKKNGPLEQAKKSLERSKRRLSKKEAPKDYKQIVNSKVLKVS